MPNETGTVVALSGGQDSATCLYWALRRWPIGSVSAVSFDYGQRHKIELELAERLALRTGVPHTILTLDAFVELGAASLTNPDIPNVAGAAIAFNAPPGVRGPAVNLAAAERGLPASFVPGRNIVLLGLAAALAVQEGKDSIVTGVCQADDAGYPDCRDVFVLSMERTIRVGMDTPSFTINAPLLNLNKAGTFDLADKLGVLDVILEDTNTCYEGNRDARHEWGYGCGVCPACVTRAKGFHEFEDLRAVRP